MATKVTVRLNSMEKIEQLLQETYDQACKLLQEIQNEMNKLVNSCDLSDTPIDEKAKYSKAIHDYIGDKKTALTMKMEIAKLMTEVLKHNGDARGALNDPNFSKATKLDLKALRQQVNSENDTQTYNIK